jgi:hypothetical protein
MWRRETPEVAAALQSYSHLVGYHAHEWDRFVIEAPDFYVAARVAAGLEWWLHCWSWEPSAEGIVIRDSTGRHVHDPLCRWKEQSGDFPASNCSDCSRIAKVRFDMLQAGYGPNNAVTPARAAQIAVEALEAHRPHGYVCSCGAEINNTRLHLTQVVEDALVGAESISLQESQ